jgi:hypothetical protein
MLLVIASQKHDLQLLYIYSNACTFTELASELPLRLKVQLPATNIW